MSSLSQTNSSSLYGAQTRISALQAHHTFDLDSLLHLAIFAEQQVIDDPGIDDDTPALYDSIPNADEPDEHGADIWGIDEEVPPKDESREATPTQNPRPTKRPRPQSYAHIRRRAKRNDCASRDGKLPRLKDIRRIVGSSLELKTSLETDSLPAMRGAYTAKPGEYSNTSRRYTLRELTGPGFGFKLVKWDGITPRPLIDSKNRIFAVLAGRPADPTYVSAARNVANAIAQENKTANFQRNERIHRRGHFPALAVGVSYGNGQTRPEFLRHSVHADMLARLIGDPSLQRLATFASAAFALWAPNLYAYYKSHLDTLYTKLPHLAEGRNFSKSIFPCATINFGPNVWTFKHRDSLNCPFGWCAIQALGSYNPKTSGHLILWDLKMVIEFPPASTILIPSATIAHSNIPVQPHETRFSFTQYCAGGIFRWVDNGCRTEDQLALDDPEEMVRMDGLKDARFHMGIGLYSTMDNLLDAATN